MNRIRHASHDDQTAVIAIWRECDLIKSQNDPYQDFDLALATSASTILVLEEESESIGAVVVGFDGHRAWFYYLGVKPAFQSLGYGRLLIEAIEKWAAEQGAPKAMLMVRNTNVKVIEFYEKLGYTVEDTSVLGKRL